MKCLFCRVMSILGLTITLFSACRSKEHNAESVEQAMQKYNRYILRMDVDSIAFLYTPDGELGKMARGRDSIRRFLENFKKYKVLSQVSKTNLINIHRDTALQSGLYTQKVIVPVNDTVTVKGLFSTKWIWMDSTGWHIQRMETTPSK
jgi:SnoaL-like domain